MKFVNVRLLAGDFVASFRFWKDVMGFPVSYGDESSGYAYFTTDSAGIELMSGDAFVAEVGIAAAGTAPSERRGVLVFGVDDVDATYASLVERGATPLV